MQPMLPIVPILLNITHHFLHNLRQRADSQCAIDKTKKQHQLAAVLFFKCHGVNVQRVVMRSAKRDHKQVVRLRAHSTPPVSCQVVGSLAPTFHEQRSLSERLYRDQGVDTQKLLGHKTQKMTDRYNDDRGKDWVILSAKTGS